MLLCFVSTWPYTPVIQTVLGVLMNVGIGMALGITIGVISVAGIIGSGFS